MVIFRFYDSFYFLCFLLIQIIIPTIIIINGNVNITNLTIKSSDSVGAYVTVECVFLIAIESVLSVRYDIEFSIKS